MDPFAWMIIGFFLHELFIKILDRLDNPYRWKCPECTDFRFKCNDQALYDRILLGHLEASHISKEI